MCLMLFLFPTCGAEEATCWLQLQLVQVHYMTELKVTSASRSLEACVFLVTLSSQCFLLQHNTSIILLQRLRAWELLRCAVWLLWSVTSQIAACCAKMQSIIACAPCPPFVLFIMSCYNFCLGIKMGCCSIIIALYNVSVGSFLDTEQSLTNGSKNNTFL